MNDDKIIQFQFAPPSYGFLESSKPVMVVLTKSGRMFYQLVRQGTNWKEWNSYPKP